MKKYADFFSHLEFVGYSITEEDDYWAATGGTHPAILLINEIDFGLLFIALYPRDEGLTYELLNDLNNKALVSRFTIPNADTLSQECFYPESYDKVSFGRFLDGIREDMITAIEITPETEDELEK